ncbi:uncharacterized protein N7518_003957 [Penicillium psychrosexuale]|uniref:uncharacterized protein n=1 Tax=Penicillium psychrosexuale TaxID=1002107 RepID=UPI0025454861|nr:uncharacterized protein N7518_003957 [Penicillium psychrosexuale]KAJ5795417.1 hypothetical protein N7518_003957 [Penicillium psychrosexuale]
MPLVILGGKRDRQNNRGRQRQQLCADTDPRPRVSPAKRVLKRGQYRSEIRERYGKLVEEVRI